MLINVNKSTSGVTIFGYQVADPTRYGVIGSSPDGVVDSLIEKPAKPLSNYVATGLYFLDSEASTKAKSLKPSARGELEILSLLEIYMSESKLTVEKIGRGHTWVDTGTHGSLIDTGNFVRRLQKRQGLQIGNIEEIAFKNSWINRDELERHATFSHATEYGRYLLSLLNSQSK